MLGGWVSFLFDSVNPASMSAFGNKFNGTTTNGRFYQDPQNYDSTLLKQPYKLTPAQPNEGQNGDPEIEAAKFERSRRRMIPSYYPTFPRAALPVDQASIIDAADFDQTNTVSNGLDNANYSLQPSKLLNLTLPSGTDLVQSRSTYPGAPDGEKMLLENPNIGLSLGDNAKGHAQVVRVDPGLAAHFCGLEVRTPLNYRK